MEQDLSRIGVSLPENLLEKFDEIITKEAIRLVLRVYGTQ